MRLFSRGLRRRGDGGLDSARRRSVIDMQTEQTFLVSRGGRTRGGAEGLWRQRHRAEAQV
jgi:hypothetical protein